MKKSLVLLFAFSLSACLPAAAPDVSIDASVDASEVSTPDSSLETGSDALAPHVDGGSIDAG